MGVKWKGLIELQNGLKERQTLEKAKNIIRTNGAELQQKAVRAAPYKTGNLRRSINLQIKENGMAAVVTATADYAGYLEYGTRRMRARPYMRPSARVQALRFIKDLERLLK